MMSRSSFGPRFRGFLRGFSALLASFLVIWYTFILSGSEVSAPDGDWTRTAVSAATRLQTEPVYLFQHRGT
jgi:hypothetical protein